MWVEVLRQRRDHPRAEAWEVTLAALAAEEHRAFRVDADDAGIRTDVVEVLHTPADRASGAHRHVQLIRDTHIPHDLGHGAVRMRVEGRGIRVLVEVHRVGDFLEELRDLLLTRREPVAGGRIRLLDHVHSGAKRLNGRQRRGIDPRIHHAVELPSAQERLPGQRHAQVSGAGLHQGRRLPLPSRDLTGCNGAFHQALRRPVFGATARVELFQFDPDLHVSPRAQPLQTKQGRITGQRQKTTHGPRC